MIIRLQIEVKIAVALLVTLSVACSTDKHHQYRANGDDTYLDLPALKALQAPAGIILPLQNSDFAIPATSLTQPVGKQVDIRPPEQAVALLRGSRAEYANGIGKLLVENNARYRNMWAQVLQIIQDNNFPITSHQRVNQTLTTDWLKWPRADEDVPFEGRYQISVKPEDYQLVLVVRSLELQKEGEIISDKSAIQRYNSMMLNTIISGLDQFYTDAEKISSGSDSGILYVQSGTDETGLPMLIVRTTYNEFWQRLPAALEKAGMKVVDSSRSQGMFKVAYKPGSVDWAALGAKDPLLKEGEYKVQVGDLNNRSSLQFIDPKGHTLTQAQNDALVAVFQATLNQTETKAK